MNIKETEYLEDPKQEFFLIRQYPTKFFSNGDGYELLAEQSTTLLSENGIAILTINNKILHVINFRNILVSLIEYKDTGMTDVNFHFDGDIALTKDLTENS